MDLNEMGHDSDGPRINRPKTTEPETNPNAVMRFLEKHHLPLIVMVLIVGVVAAIYQEAHQAPEEKAAALQEVVSISEPALSDWEPMTLDGHPGQVRYLMRTHTRRNGESYESCDGVAEFALELPEDSKVINVDTTSYLSAVSVTYLDSKGRAETVITRRDYLFPRCSGNRLFKHGRFENFSTYPKGSEPED